MILTYSHKDVKHFRTITMDVVFSPVNIHLMVCEQDYTKTAERIPTELEWRMGLSPEQTPLTFGADPDKEQIWKRL